VVDENHWYCFGACRRGGATLHFVAAMEGTDMATAARLLETWFPHRALITPRRTPMATRPSHRVLAVTARDSGKNVLTRIGAAWPVKNGLSLQLHALPVSGRLLVLSEDAETDETSEETAS
jgi:hypothetical protein